MTPYVNVKCFGAVGDGVTDDSTAIRVVMSAAGATYGAVYFPPGVYLVSEQQTSSAYCFLAPSNMAFIGAGQGLSTIRVAPGQGTQTRIFTLNGVQNVRFADLTLDGNRAGQEQQEHRAGIFIMEASNVHIERVTCRDFWGDGIHLYINVSDIVIRDCHIHDCGRDGIALTGCNSARIVIKRCHIHDVTAAPIHSEPDSNPDGPITQVTIRDCTLVAAPAMYAVTVGGKSAATPNTGWLVDGNTITGTIDVIRCEDLRITNNTITGAGLPAISGRYHTRRITITGNNVACTEHPAISIQAVSGEPVEAWAITANHIVMSGGVNAILIQGCGSVQIVGNTITGTGAGYGVNVYGTIPLEAAQIIGNTITNVATAIYVATYLENAIKRLLIMGNILVAVTYGIRYAGSAAQFEAVAANDNLISASVTVQGLAGLTLTA